MNKLRTSLPLRDGALASVLLLLLVAPPGVAQPLITKQPASLAVPLGSNATFQVTATGIAPLSYQWSSDAGNLGGATNATLIVSNVALSDLGSYTVVVSNAAGQTWSQPAWLKLARWTEFVYFGDSECQIPESNGPTWGDYLPDLLSLPANAKRIYFNDQATEAEVRSQIQSYLAVRKPGTSTLVALWRGGMFGDMTRLLYLPERSVSNRIANINLLADAGVTNFLVPRQSDLRLWPTVANLSPMIGPWLTNYDNLLDTALSDLAVNRRLQIFRPEIKILEGAIWASPAAYGFTNLTGNAQTFPQCDPNRCYHWDGFHVTTAANKLTSQLLYNEIVPPLVITAVPSAANGLVELEWHGGSAPFQVQHCDDLATDSWQSEPCVFGNYATNTTSLPHEFYRILNLGQ